MSEWKGSRSRLELQRRHAADTLKRCPLCGAVNALGNTECFVCTWHGGFDHDQETVEEGLGELLIRCPELVKAMEDQAPPKPTLWERLRRLMGVVRLRRS